MKRKAEEMEMTDNVQRPLKKACSPWQQYLKQFAKEKGMCILYLYIYTYAKIIIAAGEHDGAATITRKASKAYKNLSASTKGALKGEGVAQRQKMTRAEMKRRAEKIGKKIQQLVCFVPLDILLNSLII